jgi:acid phosphatase
MRRRLRRILAGSLGAGALLLALGCTTVAQVTTLSDPACHRTLTSALARVLEAQGESGPVAAKLADSATTELQYAALGPRPFLVASSSGTDYSFFVEQKGAACLLRLYGRQKGFVSYTNNLTYIATEPLAPCQCSDSAPPQPPPPASPSASTAAAATATAPAPSSAHEHDVLLPFYEAQRRIDEYIRSGQYDADFAAVVSRAQRWLEERAPSATTPAVVLDIDETSLSNWPAYRLNGWARLVNGGCDLEKGPCGIRAWQELGRSKALAPTLALARRARELGVAVFFITGRPPELQEATERNLRTEGYEWTAVILEPPGKSFASAADFKAPERRKIAEQGYTILLSLGDQDSDLAGGYAERTFKLPNPVYYLP